MRKQFMPKTKGRRIMAMFLSICMVFTLSPAMVFADEKWEKTEAGSMYTYEQGSLADETKECSELDESDGTDETDEFDEIDGANKIDETNETDELDENDGTDETGAFDETNGKKETSEFEETGGTDETGGIDENGGADETDGIDKNGGDRENADLTDCFGEILETDTKPELECLCDPAIEGEEEHTNKDCPFYKEKATVCNCSVLCTADQTDTECPVCREDYSLCEAEAASAVPSSDDMAVKAIIEQMEALPTVDSIYENMPGDGDEEYDAWLKKMQQIIADIRAAKEAYDGLTEEERQLVGEEYREKLLDLWNFAERLGEMKTLDVIASGTSGGCTWVLDGDGSLTISPTNGVSGTLNGLSSVDKAKVTKIVVDNEVMMSNDYNRIFADFNNCTEMDLSGLNTAGHKDFGGMFENCKSLQVLNLSGFDTSAATSLSSMFSGCKKLTTLDLSDFNTSKVTNMFEMFKGCSELTALDVSSFTTANVRNMSEMFYNCSKLTELDLSNFNTTNVTNMQRMFGGCSGITVLDFSNFSNFKTTNVTDMSSMFVDCSELTTLNVGTFDTASVTDMSNMFNGCKKLDQLDVSAFHTSNVKKMFNMFQNCSGLQTLDIENFETSNVTTMSSMFMGCSGLVELKWDNGKFNTSAVTNMSAMFSGCKSLQTLDVSNFNTSQVKDMGSMFSGCSNLTQLDVSHFDTSTVSSTYIGIVTGGMSHMFSDCSSLTELDVSHFDTSNVVLMSYMFNNCSGLKSLDISNFKTGNTIKMDGMFSGCSGLSELDVSKFDTAQVKSMAVMFYGCSGLLELNVSNFNTSNVTDMGSMFSGCESLQTLDVSNFNTSSVTVMSFMFSGCSGLLELDVSRFDTSQVMYMISMFSGCKGLQTLDISSFSFNEKCYFPNVFEGCSLGLKTEFYHAQMGGSSISIYNKHRFENMTDSDISWYKNLICTPYVITPNVTEGGTVTYSGKYGNRAACDTVYQTYFVKTAPFYNEETIAPEFDAAKFYAQDGEGFKISYTPLDGYAVTKVVVDDMNINLKQYPKEYTMKVTKDMEVSVTFTKLVNVTLMTGNVSLRTISSAAGEKLEKPADLVKTGYIFTGWYKEPELLNQWDFDNDILNNEDINLYAKWIGITYNVTLYPNGGTIEEGEITSYTCGEGAVLPTKVTKTGYTFGGWYDNPECTGYSPTKAIFDNATGDKTFYAKWNVNSYWITLYTLGGSIQEGNVTKYTYGQGAVLPTNVTRAGYKFAGWYDNFDCTGEPVVKISASDIGDKGFYAKWSANSYTITLNTNEGTLEGEAVSEYTYGIGAVLPANVTRAGYTFAGWYDNSGLTGNPTAAISTTDTGDKTFYAKWNDTQKPVLTVSQPPKDWKAENVTLTLSYSDNEGVTALYSRLDDGSYAEITDFTAGSYQYTVSVEGEHTYTFKAVDAAGNAKETAPVTVKLDKSAPQIGTITFDSGHQSFWQWIFGRTSLEVTVPVSDPYSGADHISWVLTPAGKMPASPKTAAVTNGTAVFTVDSGFKGEILITAYDKVGNSETADVIRAALEDHQPVISVTDGTKPFTGDWYDAPQMIHVEVTDGEDGSDTESGLHTVVYTVDDNLTNTPLFTRTEGELAYYAERSFSAKEGDHTYHITAADNAGNSVTVHVTVKQDTTPPVVTELTADKAGEKSIGITFTSDDTGTYHYLVRTARDAKPDAETVIASNSADIAEAGAKVSFTADGLLPNTEYVLYLVTVDKAGNKGTVQSISFATEKEDIEGTVVLDDTAPRYGDVITVEAHLTGSNPGDLAFQWYRGDEAIDGAVKHSYTVTKDDVGESLSVKVSAENYKDVLCSAPMDPVGKRQLTVTAEAEDKIYDGTADAVISLEITEGKIDGDDVTAVGAGAFSDVDAGPEKTVVLSDIALEGADKSYYELKSQPDNPKADIGKMAGSAAPEVSSVDETYPGASDGKITGLTAGLVYEISSDNGVTWEDAVLTGTEIHNLRAGAYQVRIKESTNSLAGEMTAVTIGTTPPVHAPVPQTVFDAFLMTLAGTREGMQYSLDGGITWIDITHGTEVKLEEGITEENGIYVRQKGNGTTLLDSLPQMITITKSPVPEGIISVGETGMGLGDGKLKHVTPDMEYRKDGENAWRSCEGTEITVNPGVYYVRMKGKGTELASEEAGPYVIQKYETKAVTGIKMDVSSLILAQGASFGLTFTLEPADATDRTVVWSSSNPSVAAVAEDGSVSALHIGTAVITVKAADGGWSDSCRITVKAPGGVNGIVKDDYGPVEGATVEAREGGTDGTLAGEPAVTGADGRYIFNNLPRGIYSLVAKRTSAEGKLQVITRIIKITDEMEKCDIFMPAGDKNTIVEVKADTPPVAVDYLDELFLHENLVEVPEEGVTPEDVETVAAGGSLEIKLLAEKKERKDAAVQEDVGKIEESAGPGTGLLVLDLAVEKTVREAGAQTGSTTRLKRLPELIKIVVPIDNLSDKERIRVLRVHGGETQELPLGDEYFEVDENNLILYVNQFSIYAVAYDEEIKVSDGEKERTSDSKWIEGTWILDEVGWWYDYGNRLWPSNGWYYLPWRKEYYWYHFNKTGYIDTGWFTDTDGKIYYLHPYHDGSQGYMYTGWNFIDGNWYYFETKQGKEKGMLYVNRKTPDGYLVDASGAWVQ